MNGKEIISLIKENKNIDKTNMDVVNLLMPNEQANNFLKKYQGLSQYPQNQIKNDNYKNIDSNISKKPVREYVDQVLDKDFEKLFSNFIIKLRDIYYKKKSVAPLKAKKRVLLGMREIEKKLRLNEVLLLFVVPYIEKVTDVKNSLDERLLQIFSTCHKKNIPIFFGLNKFKLGQIARKKFAGITMLAIINVEGMENELKNIVEIGNEFREKWYEKNSKNKEIFKDNKYIQFELFDKY